jgi:hypothetical protein
MLNFRNRNIDRSLILFFKYALFIFANFFIYRLIFFSYNIKEINQSNKDFVAQAFSVGIRFDLRLSALLFIPILIALIIPYFDLFKKKWGRRSILFVQGLNYLVIHIIFLADLAFMGKFSRRIDASVLDAGADYFLRLKSLWGSYQLSLIIILGLILSFMHYMFMTNLMKNFVIFVSKRSFVSSIISRSIILFGLLLMFFGKASLYPLRWNDAYFSTDQYISQFSLNPVLNILETYPFWKNKLQPNNPTTLEVKSFKEKSPRKVLNIVMIELKNINSTKVLKNSKLKNLMDLSWSFPNCYVTSDILEKNLFSILTGNVDVTTFKTASRNPFLVRQHLILNSLIDHEKFYFSNRINHQGNIRGIWSHNIDGLQIYDDSIFDNDLFRFSALTDQELFLQAKIVMDKQTKPFFIYIQTSNQLASNFQSLDEVLGDFFDQMKSSTYYKDTLLIVYGGYHNGFDKSAINDYRVPLIFHHANILSPLMDSRVVSVVDILPTAISYLGYPFKMRSQASDLTDKNASGKKFIFGLHGDKNSSAIITDRFLFLQHGEQANLKEYAPDLPTSDVSSKYPDEFSKLKNLNLSYLLLSQFLLYNNFKL